MEYGKVFLDSISVGRRARSIDKGRVNDLAASIEAIGLQQPISIYAPDEKTCVLVAGHHRIEAAKKLKWIEIDCVLVDLDDLDRELWEIDENLIRAELTEMERARHYKRRKEIFDAKAAAEKIPTSLSDGRGAGPQHQKQFDADTADKTGADKSTVRKSRKRADKIDPDVQDELQSDDAPEALKKAADSGVELDALAALKPDEQKQAVEMMKDGRAESARDAVEVIRGETPEEIKTGKQLNSLRNAWKKASIEAQQQFLDWVDAQSKEAAA